MFLRLVERSYDRLGYLVLLFYFILILQIIISYLLSQHCQYNVEEKECANKHKGAANNNSHGRHITIHHVIHEGSPPFQRDHLEDS